MQLLSLSVILLALGAQAVPTKEGHGHKGKIIDKPNNGNETVSTYALGQCTSFEGQCLVNGRRQICQIGTCSGVNTNCDNDGGVVSCA